VDAGATSGLSIDNDPAAGVDADVVTPVGGVVTGVVAGTDDLAVDATVDATVGGVFGTLDVAVNTVTGLTSTGGLLDPVLDESAILPATSSVVGSVVGPEGVVGGVVDLDGTLHGVGGTVAGVGGLVGGLGQPADAGAGHGAVDGVTDLLF
jgi:hypothetical protein